MNISGAKQSFNSFEDMYVALLAGPIESSNRLTYSVLPDDIPDLHEADLVAEGDVETYSDPFATGDAYTEYEVELTDVRHKESGRPIEISALSTDMRDALEQRVLDEWLKDRR